MRRKPLVALVAGATRGAGRGIAVALGEIGATVWCTGRSSGRRPRKRGAPFDLDRRPETIEETAELVSARGGRGIAVKCDHSDEAQVRALMRRVRRLDVLVNDIWGGDFLTEWGRPFWKCSVERALRMIARAVFTHIITARHAAPLMRRGGLVVEMTDGDSHAYRGSFFYDFVKASVLRLAFNMAEELRPRGIASIAVTPGWLRSEAMLEAHGVTEANWKDAARKTPNFIASETPLFVGRAVAALAKDPRVFAKTGRAYASWTLAREYGFTDADGTRPDWGRHFATAKSLRKLWRKMEDSHRRFAEMRGE